MSGTVDAIQTVFNIFDPLPLDCLIPICKRIMSRSSLDV